MHKDDIAAALDAAIAVVEAVDRRIVLVVAADGGENQRFRFAGALSLSSPLNTMKLALPFGVRHSRSAAAM